MESHIAFIQLNSFLISIYFLFAVEKQHRVRIWITLAKSSTLHRQLRAGSHWDQRSTSLQSPRALLARQATNKSNQHTTITNWTIIASAWSPQPRMIHSMSAAVAIMGVVAMRVLTYQWTLSSIALMMSKYKIQAFLTDKQCYQFNLS